MQSSLSPNQYVAGDYGLHKFKDGAISLLIRHSCGDWQTVRTPTEIEIEWFKKNGQPVEKTK